MEQEESARRWRDGADARNAQDAKDWTMVSEEEMTGQERSGAVRKHQAGAEGECHATTGNATFAEWLGCPEYCSEDRGVCKDELEPLASKS